MRIPIDNSRRAGQSLVEVAILLPVLLLLVLGVAEFGNVINAYIGVTNAAREGARLASRGNIYSNAQIAQVIAGQTGNLNLSANGSIVLTVIKYDVGPLFTYTVTQLLGSATTRFTAASLATLHAQAIATSNQTYLRKESFVVIEVFYNCPSLTSFLSTSFPVYGYTVMKISAAS